MVFNTGAALLDAIVLAVISREKDGTYGYKITQDVRSVLEVSESTLYPVLRRLQKDECLEAYNMEYAGRNRKYYKLTDKGAAQLNLYRSEWISMVSIQQSGCYVNAQERNLSVTPNGVPPPLSRGGFGISESFPSSPEAPLGRGAVCEAD